MSTILGAVGPKGSGKTSLMVAVAHDEYRRFGRRIVSDFRLNFKHTPLKFPEDEDQDVWLRSGYTDCLILLDEAQMFANARKSFKQDNIAVSWLLQQSRKLGVDVFWSSQRARQVDVLIREHTDAVFECENRAVTLKEGDSGGRNAAWLTVCQVWYPRGRPEPEEWKAGPRFAFNRREVYGLFDSYEVITRIQA